MKYFEAHYIYKGKKNKKLFEAKDKESAIAIAKLKSQGVIVRVYQVSPPLKDRLRDIFTKSLSITLRKNIKTPQLISSIRQLSVMTNASISIHDSIKEVKNATQDKSLRAIFSKIDDDLNAGNSLSSSIKAFKNELGEVTLAMVELGENTGDMSSALEKLAQIQEDIWDNRQKFKKAIRYPLTVLITIFIAFTILMLYVVPKFKTIFDKFQAKLPLPTRILLEIEQYINSYGVYMLLFFILSTIFIRYLYKTNETIKFLTDKYILKIYLIGDIIFYSSMGRFWLIFSELIQSGIPITSSLDTATSTIANTYLKKRLGRVKLSVEQGSSLTHSLKETNLYESMIVQMISAGEKSGNLDFMLKKISEYFKSKFSNILDNITSLIEPVLIGFIAIFVLILALGIFMPMWDMAKAIRL